MAGAVSDAPACVFVLSRELAQILRQFEHDAKTLAGFLAAHAGHQAQRAAFLALISRACGVLIFLIRPSMETKPSPMTSMSSGV